MALPTDLRLDHPTVTKLRELAQLNIDSRDGFDFAAERIEQDAPLIAQQFRQWSDERAKFVQQLDGVLRGSGEEAQEDGSWTASIHRTWMNIRDMFSLSEKTDIYAVVAEAERGEDIIKAAYEDAGQSISGGLLGIINDQYASIKLAHDTVRDLRDSLKRAST